MNFDTYLNREQANGAEVKHPSQPTNVDYIGLVVPSKWDTQATPCLKYNLVILIQLSCHDLSNTCRQV